MLFWGSSFINLIEGNLTFWLKSRKCNRLCLVNEDTSGTHLWTRRLLRLLVGHLFERQPQRKIGFSLPLHKTLHKNYKNYVKPLQKVGWCSTTYKMLNPLYSSPNGNCNSSGAENSLGWRRTQVIRLSSLRRRQRIWDEIFLGFHSETRLCCRLWHQSCEFHRPAARWLRRCARILGDQWSLSRMTKTKKWIPHGRGIVAVDACALAVQQEIVSTRFVGG